MYLIRNFFFSSLGKNAKYLNSIWNVCTHFCHLKCSLNILAVNVVHLLLTQIDLSNSWGFFWCVFCDSSCDNLISTVESNGKCIPQTWQQKSRRFFESVLKKKWKNLLKFMHPFYSVITPAFVIHNESTAFRNQAVCAGKWSRTTLFRQWQEQYN